MLLKIAGAGAKNNVLKCAGWARTASLCQFAFPQIVQIYLVLRIAFAGKTYGSMCFLILNLKTDNVRAVFCHSHFETHQTITTLLAVQCRMSTLSLKGTWNANTLLLHTGKLSHEMVIFSPKVTQKARGRISNETSQLTSTGVLKLLCNSWFLHDLKLDHSQKTNSAKSLLLVFLTDRFSANPCLLSSLQYLNCSAEVPNAPY